MSSDQEFLLELKGGVFGLDLEKGENSNAGETRKQRHLTIPPPPPPKEYPTAAVKTHMVQASPLSSQNAALGQAIESNTTGLTETTDTTTTSPGTPAQELPRRPAPLQLSSRPGTSGSDRPAKPLKAPRPLPFRAPLSMHPPNRPSTASSQSSTGSFAGAPTRMIGSSKRLSWSSMSTSKRPIKYGKGKKSHIELVPQPSDDPEDPLNWPQWKKELNLGTLLLMVSMTGVMKTAFVTVNSQVAQGYGVSYTAATALTGVPLILSAVTGFVSLIAARLWGKRPIYLTSTLLLLIGVVWSTNVASSYGQCMTARVFQGLGWGAFDTLVMGSIHDTYFEHERCRRVAVYSIVSVATTWGSPLLGGVSSQTQLGFSLEFAVLSGLFLVALPLMTLATPETAFDRAYTLAQTPATGASYMKSLPLLPRRTFSLETAKDYVTRMKPHSYTGVVNRTVLLQVPRASIAPTTVLVFVASVVPLGTLWGLASSLSLLFAPMPFMLGPGDVGVLLTGAFVLATATVAIFALTPAWHIRFSRKLHAASLTAGTALFVGGAAAFGAHVAASMTPPASPPGGDAVAAHERTSVFALGFLGARVRFAGLAALLGLVAAGAAVIDAAARPLVRRSTQFTSSNLGVALRNTADMDGGAACWRSLAAGVFVMALPEAVWWSWASLRAACVGVSVAQAAVAVCLACIWWFWDDGVRRLDGRLMRLVDLDMLRRAGSFFDTD